MQRLIYFVEEFIVPLTLKPNFIEIGNYVDLVVKRLSLWFAINDYEISFVGKRDKMFELYVRLSKKYLAEKWKEKPQTYHYFG